MDLKKIFIKDARPTKAGGQAVLEGIMMKGAARSAVAVRLPDQRIHIKISDNPKRPRAARIPLVRGLIVFIDSLVQGMKTLTYSADVLERFSGEEENEAEEEDRLTRWLENKFGEQGAWNIMLTFSVLLAVVFTVAIFIIAPTVVTNLLKAFTTNEIVLNLFEGILRIVLFILYIVIVARMPDIHRTFEYHGAEHKCIHCYENGLPLTPENCQQFYPLHPRCGTSFLMFVMVVALILFSLLGWPSLLWRIVSRLLLLPVISGISYELLRWAGSTDNWVVRILSMPGLWLQQLTTAEPDNSQLEVAIAALKAVTADEDEYECGEGFCDADGHIVEPDPPEDGEEAPAESAAADAGPAATAGALPAGGTDAAAAETPHCGDSMTETEDNEGERNDS
ncbi:MAG: DUF1385 domain-containing protein [Anaerovoracaceae bacterium]|jgi:uncharacterized protein YqhQ